MNYDQNLWYFDKNVGDFEQNVEDSEVNVWDFEQNILESTDVFAILKKKCVTYCAECSVFWANLLEIGQVVRNFEQNIGDFKQPKYYWFLAKWLRFSSKLNGILSKLNDMAASTNFLMACLAWQCIPIVKWVISIGITLVRTTTLRLRDERMKKAFFLQKS